MWTSNEQQAYCYWFLGVIFMQFSSHVKTDKISYCLSLTVIRIIFKFIFFFTELVALLNEQLFEWISIRPSGFAQVQNLVPCLAPHMIIKQNFFDTNLAIVPRKAEAIETSYHSDFPPYLHCEPWEISLTFLVVHLFL